MISQHPWMVGIIIPALYLNKWRPKESKKLAYVRDSHKSKVSWDFNSEKSDIDPIFLTYYTDSLLLSHVRTKKSLFHWQLQDHFLSKIFFFIAARPTYVLVCMCALGVFQTSGQ